MAKRWYYKDENGNKVPVPQYKIDADDYYTKAMSDSRYYDKQATDTMLDTKVDKTDITQSTGTSTTAVMSQKAVSDIVDELKSQVIYDVTENNNGATFDSLSALLSNENLSTLIPSEVRCGGMSIRFIQSSDNKYVQYRLMANTFSTTVANWQGVDNEPTIGSNNLVKSGSVADSINKLNDIINGTQKKEVNISINTTAQSSYTDYLFDSPIPIGSTLLSMTTAVRGWLIKTDGSYNTDRSFYSFPKVTTEVYKGIAVRDESIFKIKYTIGEDTSGIKNDVDDLSEQINGKNGLVKKVENIQVSIDGAESRTISLTTTNTGWKEHLFEENMPIGAVITKASSTIPAYLLTIEGSVDTSARIDTMSVPFVTTKEYKGIIANGAGSISLIYHKGTNVIGLNDVATFKGKTIVCFGDSLTVNKGSDGRRYSDILASISGANVINVGVGGSRIQQRRVPTTNLSALSSDYEKFQTAMAMFDVVNAVRVACGLSNNSGIAYKTLMNNAVDYLKNFNPTEPSSESPIDLTAITEALYSIDWSKVDVVTVFAGTNDWNNASEYLGESGSLNASRTLGALNTIIKDISTTYKHVKLYWFTPIIRWLDYKNGVGVDNKFSDTFTRENRTLKEYSSILANEVYLNHVPCCDMYNTLGWNIYNFGEYFYRDGTHPTKGNGFDVIARKIFAFIMANRTF